jgi:hypothetical protein
MKNSFNFKLIVVVCEQFLNVHSNVLLGIKQIKNTVCIQFFTKYQYLLFCTSNDHTMKIYIRSQKLFKLVNNVESFT